MPPCCLATSTALRNSLKISASPCASSLCTLSRCTPTIAPSGAISSPRHDCHEVLDDDPPHLRIAQVDHPLGTAPSIAGRLRVGKAIAVVPDVAVSSDVIEDQVDSGPERQNEMTRIDVESADFAPRHRLIKTLQHHIVHGSRQARCPVLLFQLLRLSR